MYLLLQSIGLNINPKTRWSAKNYIYWKMVYYITRFIASICIEYWTLFLYRKLCSKHIFWEILQRMITRLTTGSRHHCHTYGVVWDHDLLRNKWKFENTFFLNCICIDIQHFMKNILINQCLNFCRSFQFKTYHKHYQITIVYLYDNHLLSIMSQNKNKQCDSTCK